MTDFKNWEPPKNDLIFQYECQVIQDAITPLFCDHCMETVLPTGLTKREHAVYTIYNGIKGGLSPAEAMDGIRQLFDLDDAGVVQVALQVDKVIIPKMKEIESSPHKIYLNESIRSCINGFSWN